MMKYLIIFSLAILNISTVKSLNKETSNVKGSRPLCSLPRYTREQCSRIRFRFMCNVNSDCTEKGHICCNNGCVGACQLPQPSVTSTPLNNALQNATCPPPSLTSDQCMYVKFASCESDASCGENKKCCNNGCGTTCMTPQCTKSGSCSSANINCFHSQCKSDCDCPGIQKCCHGCLCTNPV